MSWGNANKIAASYRCGPVGMAKPRTPCHQTLAWLWSLGLPCTAGEMRQAALRKTLGSVLQNHTCSALQSSCGILWCLPGEVESVCPHQSLTHNCSHLVIWEEQPAFSRRENKLQRGGMLLGKLLVVKKKTRTSETQRDSKKT